MARKWMSKGDVQEMAHAYFPSFLRSRHSAIVMDRWMNGRQYELGSDAPSEFSLDIDPDDPAYGLPFSPRTGETSDEFDNLRGLAPNNFAGLVVTSLAQTAHVEGIRRPGVKDNLPSWKTWQRNGWDAKQIPLHRAAIGMSTAYGIVLPGRDGLTGDPMSKMLARSPKTMAAFFDTDDDEFPRIAIEAHPRYERADGFSTPIQVGWDVDVYDAYVVHRLIAKGKGLNEDDWTYLTHDEHNLPVCPVAALYNRIDLDGRAYGEIEPVLPLLRRIDQDTFDRLINQRFGAWQIRYIAGMAKPSKASDEKVQAMKLSVADILISTDHQTKFGTIPGGDIDAQIKATDHDLRLLSAISQTPPHHLLGLSSNLQAEALAAAESGLLRKSFDFRTNAGEFHERMARLSALAEGDLQTARAYDLQVRWRDPEAKSMSQAADALGKLATQLGVPVEILWEKIPGWTDTDVARAKELVEDGTFQKLVNELLKGEEPQADPATPLKDAPSGGQ